VVGTLLEHNTGVIKTLKLPILVRFISFHLSQLRLKRIFFSTLMQRGILDIFASFPRNSSFYYISLAPSECGYKSHNLTRWPRRFLSEVESARGVGAWDKLE